MFQVPKFFIGGNVKNVKALAWKLIIGWNMQQQSQLAEVVTRHYFIVTRKNLYLRVTIL